MFTRKLEKDLNSLFGKLNVKKNDNIFLHLNSCGLINYRNKKKSFKVFFDKIINKIGKDGTLIIPTYNYDFTKNKIFNSDLYNSQVGEMTNFFMKKYKCYRTKNPVFSHAVYGNLQVLFKSANNKEAFSGKNNFFSMIMKKKFKIFGFCTNVNNITFIHYIEKKLNVTYRFDKNFYSKIIENGKLKKFKYKYFVGKKKFDYTLKHQQIYDLFCKSNYFYHTTFNRLFCYSIPSRTCFSLIKRKVLKNHYFLIEKKF